MAELWRHPIKGHGAEPIGQVRLEAGRTMPWDRVWAIAHEAARVEPGTSDSSPCVNFSRGAKSPSLMAIRAETDEVRGRVRLSRPDATPIEVDPDDAGDQARLIAWALPLSDPNRARPAIVVRGGRGLTDSPFPSISILSLASLRALSGRVGRALAPERFRGNIWIAGLEPWEESGWISRAIRIGGARLAVRERIGRCEATAVDPATGRPDADTLEAGWGHTDFGLYAEVVEGGAIALGDEVAP